MNVEASRAIDLRTIARVLYRKTESPRRYIPRVAAILVLLGGEIVLNRDQNTAPTPMSAGAGIRNSLPQIEVNDLEIQPKTLQVDVEGQQLGETTIDVIHGNPNILLLGGGIKRHSGQANNTANRIFGYKLNSNYEITSPVPKIIKVIPDAFWPTDADSMGDLNFLQFGNGKLLVSVLAMTRDGDRRKACPGRAVQWFVTEVDVNDPQNPKLLFASNYDSDCLKYSPEKPAIALGENGGFIALADMNNNPGLSQKIIYRGPDGVQKITDYHDSAGVRMIDSAVNYIGDNRYLIFSKGIGRASGRREQKNVKLFYRIFDAATGKNSSETEIVSENGENPLANFLGVSSFKYLEAAFGCLQAGGTKDYSFVTTSYFENRTENTEQNPFTSLVVIVDNKTGKAIVKKLPFPLLNPSIQTLGDEVFVVGSVNYSERKDGGATIGNFNDVAIEIDPARGSILDTFSFQQYQAVVRYEDPVRKLDVWAPRSDYAMSKLVRINGQLYLLSYQSNIWKATDFGYRKSILNVPGAGIDTVYTD